MRDCAIQGCGGEHWGRGYCRRHCVSLQRHGDALHVDRSRPAWRDELDRKRCGSCREWRPEGDFSRSVGKSDGLNPACRKCVSIRTRLRRYGVDIPPDAACDMCGGDNGGRTLNVDHDHDCCDDGPETCGQCVRGFLCYTCNLRLAVLDNRKWMKMAESYLARSKSGAAA